MWVEKDGLWAWRSDPLPLDPYLLGTTYASSTTITVRIEEGWSDVG